MTLADFYQSITLDLITDFVSSGREEDLHLEFKTLSSPTFDRNDRKNLAKALSGFANSDGGLIIWGIEATKNEDGIDCATQLIPIPKIQLCLTKLIEFGPSASNPMIEGVEHRIIQDSSGTGYALTLVPPSDSGPHMAKLGEDRYYKRSGDSFRRMEHFDIEDMFGRRKKPELVLNYSVPLSQGYTKHGDGRVIRHARVVLRIENHGRGSAVAPFIEITLSSPFKGEIQQINNAPNPGLAYLVKLGGSDFTSFGGNANFVIHPETGCNFLVAVAHVEDSEEVPALRVWYKFAAENCRMTSGQILVPSEEILASLGRP